MTIREGKALKFLYVPDSYAGGIQEGDETPVFIDGVDPAGSAAAVAADLATHEGLTGTAVHGLGSASTLTAGAAGAAVVAEETVDGAREVLGLAPIVMPPIYTRYTSLPLASRNTGSGSGEVLYGSYCRQQTGTTPNSTQELYINNTIANSFLQYTQRFNFELRLDFFMTLTAGAATERVFDVFLGKQRNQPIGPAAVDNYIGLRIENNQITTGYVSVVGVVSSVTLIPSPTTEIAMLSKNGTVQWWSGGAKIGETTGGPTSTVSAGTIRFELRNGATGQECEVLHNGFINGYGSISPDLPT